ncbi:Histidine kinase [Methanosarcina thermophila]|jgi:two-component sensor histidine kinase|uniref:Histidine kinase n=1 Tax=Methanosarcina thermophila TaxID=2210 RepID=A0A1I7BD35_METTE|nr:histidine kinase dimerization/phosphoacceptor domain -containing protein [Methanosarcina thermophila]SFT85002.1 Histidine kinase [Methanosarcina thermophila]
MALIHEELHEGGEINRLNFSLYLENLVEIFFPDLQAWRFQYQLKHGT